MRTRRSPRNQERLFKALFPKPEVVTHETVRHTEAEIDTMWWLSKTSRNLMKRDAIKNVSTEAR